MRTDKFKSAVPLLSAVLTGQLPALLLLPCFLFLAVGCSGEGGIPAGSGLVELRVRAGDAAADRSSSAYGIPVRILAYARPKSSADTEAFVAPARVYVAEGSASGIGGNDSGNGENSGGNGTSLMAVRVTRVNNEPVPDGRLLVEPGYTYDIVLLMDASPRRSYTGSDGTERPKFGELQGAYVSGFTHGSDILAGRATGVRVESTAGFLPVEVSFIGSGGSGEPDALGRLPHLGSAVRAEARLGQGMFDLLLTGEKRSVNLGVDNIRFNSCLPAEADLPLAGGDRPRQMAYAIRQGGYQTSFTADFAEKGTVPVTAPYDAARPDENIAVSGNGYLLPCPLKDAATGCNVANLTLSLLVDGSVATLDADGVKLPEFKPGYRYTFVAELDADPATGQGSISLLLDVEPWSSVSWSAGEGGYGNDERMQMEVGEWKDVSYTTGEGAYDKDARLAISVGDFTPVSWSSAEGGYGGIPGTAR